MPLTNTDLFVVSRGDSIYKVPSSELKLEYSSEAAVHVGDTPPTNPTEGTLWWSTLEGNLFIWYDDGNSEQWVDASPAFVEIDYSKIEEYIDESVATNAVSQIVAGDNISVSPGSGKGVVTIDAVIPDVDLSPYATKVYVDDENAKQDEAVRLDQLRQDTAIGNIEDDITVINGDISGIKTEQIQQNNQIADLNTEVADLNREVTNLKQEVTDLELKLEQVIEGAQLQISQLVEEIEEIKKCVFDGLTYVDGGRDNAEGIFDEPNTDGNLPHGNSIDGGNSEAPIIGCKI